MNSNVANSRPAPSAPKLTAEIGDVVDRVVGKTDTDYKHSEIAEVLDQSEANCRQILRRARQHVGVMGRRFKASTQERNDLLERFVQATRKGDMEGLVALLSRDVALHSDGGGKAIALPDQIHGAETVARGLLTSFKKNVPKSIVGRISQINGQRGLIGYLNGKPFSVLSFHIRDGRIQAIYVVTNPEKLSHLPGLRATLT